MERPEDPQQRQATAAGAGAGADAATAGAGADGAGVPTDLLASFLEEGRQAVAGIAAAVAELGGQAAGGGAPAELGSQAADGAVLAELGGQAAGGAATTGDATGDARRRLELLTHRLRGSAALFGFQRMSELAGAMEELADRLGAAGDPTEAAGPAGAGPDGQAGALPFLQAAAAALARALDDVAAGGDDRAADLTGPGGATAPSWPAAVEADAVEVDGVQADAAPTDALEADAVAAELRQFVAADPTVLEYFGPEAEEHVEAMAGALAAIRQRGPAEELVTQLFRAVHTLKGAAYTVGCGPIARLAHGMEDLLAALRDGSAGWSGAAQPALAEGVETLRLLLAATLAAAGEHRGAAAPAAAQVPASLSEATEGALLALGAPAMARPDGGQAAAAAAEAPDFRGALQALGLSGPSLPAATGFRSSIRVSIDRIDRLMNLIGELVIARGRLDRRLERLGELEELALAEAARMSQAVEEFGSRHLYPQLQAATVDTGLALRTGPDIRSTGPGAGAGPWAATGPRALTGTAAQNGPAALSGPAVAPGGGAFRAATAAELFAELEFDRYDDFNLLARRTAEATADLDELHGEIGRLATLLRDDAGQLQRLLRDLRTGIGRARMVPIGQLFARFRRLVAATAAAAGKEVGLELEGETVEVDAAVAEAIADPLMHLVQNAVIHGIEPPELRRALAKPETGLLLLRAHFQGRFVTVEVEDDGAGIDVEALRRQAVALGLRPAASVAALGREQAIELIFVPGLSTSPGVTQAAGRGIGMDVVRTNLNRLGGEIAIETEAGAGTRFTLKAPLTLVVSEAVFVRVGDATFAIPVTAVRRMLHAGEADLAAAPGGGEELLLRGGAERLPLLRLDRLFGLAGRRTEPLLPVVMLAAGGKGCALAVDELLGVEEVVIKGLGELLAGLPLFSGAIVTAEGGVVLLLDAPAFTLDPPALAAAAAAATAASTAAPAAAAFPAAGLGPGSPPRSATPAAAPAGAGTGTAGGGRELLLVDDSVSVRKAVGQMLGRHGYRITAVADGEEALEALRQQRFDAVLTDLEMPRLNGYELIEEIRRGPGGRDLPIVVITTRAGGKHLDLARQLGATACFGKPFDGAALVSLLDGLGPRPGATAAKTAGGGSQP